MRGRMPKMKHTDLDATMAGNPQKLQALQSGGIELDMGQETLLLSLVQSPQWEAVKAAATAVAEVYRNMSLYAPIEAVPLYRVRVEAVHGLIETIEAIAETTDAGA